MPLHAALKDKGIPEWEEFLDSRIIMSFSTRHAGNMSLRYADTAGSIVHRKKFLSRLGIDHRHLVCAKQVHGDTVSRVGTVHCGRGADAYETSIADTDAFITNERGVPIAIFTADCLPIFVYDPATHSAGLIHAGWRSTAVKIAVTAVGAMEKEFHAKPALLRVYFGPALRACCYEVSKEFTEIFPQEHCWRSGKLFFDLIETNRKQLLSAGVDRRHIHDCEICTCCSSDEYFSYRREGASCGRMMSVVMLV